ncbi:MAG TPA: pitrilysin family protein [bacterium]|nr:pitrilysin family protein [bacterium]HPN34163.1 pitrilysin family protein [bacterium]
MKTATLLFMMTTALAAGSGPGFNLPAPQTFKLPNGMTVFYLQDRSLPLVGFRLLINGAGAAAEPESLEGAADLMAELMMKGAAGKSALQVAEELDELGADLQIKAGDEFLSLSGQSLARYWPKLLSLTCDCLLRPDFSEAEFIKERERRIDQIKAIKDNPSHAVTQYFRKAYLAGHPFGRLAVGSEASLQAMTVKDIRVFYRSAIRPDQALLAVVGDFSPAELRNGLEKNFSQWKKSGTKASAVVLPPLPLPRGKQGLLVDKPDASQAYFIIGAPGIAVVDQHAAAAQVMNTLFGGRFTSRLNNELRVKRGLTYGARSTLESWRPGGLFTISSYTRNEKIGEMLQVSLDLLRQAALVGFDEEEVVSGRNYVLGQFPPKFETLMSKARAYTDLAFYGLPFDYYAGLLSRVGSSDREAVHAQARRLMPQEDYVLVVVGKAEEIREQLAPFADWKFRSITDDGF